MREMAQNNPSLEHCYISQLKQWMCSLKSATADMHISGYVLCTQARELLSGERSY